jgi:hypothetical protein
MMVAGTAAQKLMMQLSKEQEVLMNIADVANDVYVAESLLLRVEKMVTARGADACEEYIAIMKCFIFDAADRINKSGKDALMAFVEDDELRMMLMGLKRFTKVAPYNTKNGRQLIATKLIEKGEYCLSDAVNL